MIDTILFDLDGTLLPFTQEDFIAAYMKEIGRAFLSMGFDPAFTAKSLWAGTAAMMKSDGATRNSERFWSAFAAVTALSRAQLAAVEDMCERFYTNEFNEVKSILRPADPALPRRLVRSLAARGFSVVLATNPLFPACGIATRLDWVGLTPDDFCLVTDYANSTYCKPDPGYYQEIFKKCGKAPQSCLMVGNNASEDMSVAALGTEVYLVTDFLENEESLDITGIRRGTLAEAEAFLAALPDVR